MFNVGDIIHDPEGNEWRIVTAWDYTESKDSSRGLSREYWCLGLIGMSGKMAGQMGGYRTEFEGGGLTVNVR